MYKGGGKPPKNTVHGGISSTSDLRVSAVRNTVSLLIALDKEVRNEQTNKDQQKIGRGEYGDEVGRVIIHHVGERLQVILLCNIGYVSNIKFWNILAEHVCIGLRSGSLKSLDDKVEDSNSVNHI